MLKTVSEVVDALGGNRPVADLLGVGVSAVSNWRTWNRFPARLHYRIFRECEARGLEVDAALFESDATDLAFARTKPLIVH